MVKLGSYVEQIVNSKAGVDGVLDLLHPRGFGQQRQKFALLFVRQLPRGKSWNMGSQNEFNNEPKRQTSS